MQVTSLTHIVEYPLLSRGKVRDIYEISSDTLLIVTTDRMSAFDVIMGEAIPYKGVVLNQITLFWLEKFGHIVENHLLEHEAARFPKKLLPYREMLEGRSMLVRKASPLLLECVVRGNITGSGWKDYKATGQVCGYRLPVGLKESQRLDEPLFTPATKAEVGRHDENITREEGMRIAGEEVFLKIEALSLEIFKTARDYAAGRGIIIADTKFEFGFVGPKLYLIDEVLTPDSSRFWPSECFVPGGPQSSFDKQYLRDWLETTDWDKTSPPPRLPEDVVQETARRYREAYRLLTAKELPF